MKLSLTAKLLVVVLALSFTFTAVCAVTGFMAFRRAFVQAKLADLTIYANGRERSQDAVFRTLTLKHMAAARALSRRLDILSDAQVDRMFERDFLLKPDGTRRTDSSLYDGRKLPSGQVQFGLGGYIIQRKSVSQADKRLLLAALDVVQEVGETEPTINTNFAFITPSGSALVFAPARADRLWRPRAAPLSQLGMLPINKRLSAAFSGDTRVETQCVQGPDVQSTHPTEFTARVCFTPVRMNGRYVGAFGTVLNEGNYLPAVFKGIEPGVSNLIITDKGELVAASGEAMEKDDQKLTPSQREKRRMDAAKSVMADIKASGRSSGVFDNRGHNRLVAFTRLEVPSLYFVAVTSRAAIERHAAWTALSIIGAGLVALLGMSLMIFLYTRRLIVRPLERLASHSLRLRAAPGPLDTAVLGEVSDLEARTDEIGDLAHCLAEERARADEILQSLEERVEARTAELDRANRAKSSFLANMSHELRTPLNGVVALSDLLAKRQTRGEDREMAELVVSSAKLLEQVLTDILDVSKIEAGQMTLTTEPFDLESAVGRIAQLHSAAAQRKGVTLLWTVSPAAAGRYVGDEVRITQVLSNLLSNAVKFTAEGQVSLTAEASPEGVTLTVEDSGIGFGPDMSERLFKRFEQADASITRQFGGTGLGLAICASLCELMGGSIRAHSAGRGARFTVVLPLPRAGETALWQAETAPLEAALAGTRVLLAEDHPTNQKVVCLILAPLGVEIATVGNGAEAVDLFKAEPFDVVLMDLHMPVMDGLTAIGLIRAHEAQGGAEPTPIIALTADALAEHVEATRAAGASFHLSKPIRPAALIAMLQRALTKESLVGAA